MATTHKILGLHFEKDFMIIKFENHTIKVKLSVISSKLDLASDSERNNFKISPSGYGIHWSQLDEDLSIDGLLKIAN